MIIKTNDFFRVLELPADAIHWNLYQNLTVISKKHRQIQQILHEYFSSSALNSWLQNRQKR
jgi:hypothetical protein